MSGEKLSPRQKMIGMMYLVLLAMLALQVRASVLERFVILGHSLEKSTESRVKDNARIVDHMKTAVREMGQRDADVKVLSAAIELRESTEKVISYIASLKGNLIASSGGINPETGYPKELKDDGVVARLMLNESKASELKSLLNAYAQQVSKTTGDKYLPLALDACESEFFKNDANQATKSFEVLNFEKTPISVALATLEEFASEVVSYESAAIKKLADGLGADDVKFDKLRIVVKPKSSIVAAGAKYQAEMFLCASSSGMIPEMFVDGKSIPVSGGVGNIEFIASPGKYDENGLLTKSLSTTIKMKLPGGKETVIDESIGYAVARPVIQIQSAAVQALYLNCGNELNVQVPALGTEYNPKFMATGAKVIQGSTIGLVTIIPQGSEVELSIYNNGTNLLGVQSFRVRGIPKPDIKLTSGGKPIDEKNGMPAPGPRSLEVRALPDESFKTFLPKDARYMVSEWEVTLARGPRSVISKKVVGQSVNLADFVAVAKAGDRLVIEIKKIERMNFRDEVEVVSIANNIRIIPLI